MIIMILLTLMLQITCTRFTQEISSEAGSDGLRQRLAKVHLRFYAALFAAIFVTFYCRTV